MRVVAAEIVRGFARLLAWLGGAPLWASRKLYGFADWVEGRR